MDYHNNHFAGQPGLEPVQHDEKQVVNETAPFSAVPGPDPYAAHHQYYAGAYNNSTTPVSDTYGQGTTVGQATFASDGSANDRSIQKPAAGPLGRKWVLFAGAVLIAVLAGVIGGIVGWKVTEAKGTSSAAVSTDSGSGSGSGSGTGSGSGSSNSSTSTAGAAKAIMANSALTATGWRYGSDHRIRVFYQGPDGLVRYSQYDTLFSQWSAPQVLDLAAKSGTPLAVTLVWWYGNCDRADLPPASQLELFYLNTNNVVSGRNWRDGYAATGLSDSINNNAYTASSTSQLAAYWPSILIQGSDNSIEEIAFTNTSTYAKPASLGVSGSAGTGLVALPMQTSHNGSDLRVIYRRDDGKIYTLDRGSNGVLASSTGATSFTLPSNATIAGFASSRNSGTAVNTVILWQDTSDAKNPAIKYAKQTDSNGWQGPFTDDVFNGADVPTQITCVTAGTGAQLGDGLLVPMVVGNDLNNCYFQVGGALKEVNWDGTKWSEVGFVGMP
ncbi:hypothetical protein GQ53DRAFT_227621 [Thozetella sp. PMI_491]|nr:hypothetical protein GQ53DRAFT_227621 [Thozetella sp. PMI_491]